jgi:hypothetical protein
MGVATLLRESSEKPKRTKEHAMSTTSEQRRTRDEPGRLPIFTSAGERRRSLAGVALLALTIAAVVGVLVVVLANAVL